MFYTYLPMFVMFAVVGLIASAMFLLGQFLGPKNPTPEKMQPFECGNVLPATQTPAKHRVAVKFYIVALLFILFDMETV